MEKLQSLANSHVSGCLQAAMKDKERIENVRLRERTGGYHKFVDSAEVHNPDPTSSHFVSGKDNSWNGVSASIEIAPR